MRVDLTDDLSEWFACFWRLSKLSESIQRRGTFKVGGGTSQLEKNIGLVQTAEKNWAICAPY